MALEPESRHEIGLKLLFFEDADSRFLVDRAPEMDVSSRGTNALGRRLGQVCELLALFVLMTAICLMPWWLGGVIPFARVLASIGGSAALGLVVISVAFSRRRLVIPPLGFWLLLGYAAIGVLQMIPIFPPATTEMHHAVYPVVDGDRASEWTSVQQPGVSVFQGRSIAKSFTRLHVAQWLSAGAIFCAAFDLIRSKQRVLICILAVVVNASLLTTVALIQSFGDGKMLLSAYWLRNGSRPFGTFVNPNNAAGWLCVHLAAAVALMVLVWGRDAESMPGRSWGAKLEDHFRNALTMWMSRVARLNGQHILAAFSIVLLLFGIAATLSRGGICAGLICVMTVVISQWQWKRVVVFAFPMFLICALALGSLVLFDLDADVLKELRTLKDPVSESTSRLLHWSDSLAVAWDFPVLGAGLGTYRFSTLPYQRRWVGKWFVNADNQFVEIMVEAGFLGLFLMLGFGGKLLLDSWRLRQFSGSGNNALAKSTQSFRAAGIMGWAIVPSQAFAMLFDFGAGLPATVAIVCLMAGTVSGLRSAIGTGAATVASIPDFPGYTLIALTIRVCCVIAVVPCCTDLINAHQIYSGIVESERALASPVTRDSLSKAEELSQLIQRQLADRPDDIEGLWTQMRLKESVFRLKLIDSLAVVRLNDQKLQSLWDQLSPIGLACYVQLIRSGADMVAREEIESQIREVMADHNWLRDSARLQSMNPLVPGVLADEMAAEYCLTGVAPGHSGIQKLLFVQPAGARRLFWIGHISQRAGNQVLAQQCWRQSLESTEVFRAAILGEAWEQLPPADCLALYAPHAYEDSVQVLGQIANVDLRAAVARICEEQWKRLDISQLTPWQRIQRAKHLKMLDAAAAILWIDECLLGFPEELELRRMRADLLEQNGRFKEALGEWLRIQHFDRDNAGVEMAIQRLSAKP